MKVEQLRSFFITAAAGLVLMVTTATASAQKMKTDIPKSITTPDLVETRLGTLKFHDGFPDDATVQKAYDNLDFQRGVQSFLTAMPGASLVAMRHALREVGAVNGTVAIAETLLDSKALWLTPNTDTVPAGQEANWIQPLPGKGWNPMLRLYGQLEPWFDKTWRPGEIELVK